MRIACVSDLHGNLPELSGITFDVLVIAGDICPATNHNVYFQQIWLEETFAEWLDCIDQLVIGVAGNHDFVFQKNPVLAEELPWVYLENSFTTYDGLTFWGTPYSLRYGNWAFMCTEKDVSETVIPHAVDIIITHGPPYGKGDRVLFGGGYDEYVGSHALLVKIRDIKPKLVVTGHIHESYGTYMEGETTIVNASLVDFQYRPVNPIQIVEIFERALSNS